MKAGHVTAVGEPEDAIEIVDVETPVPGPDEVRIEVKACGVTHADVFALKGHPGSEDAFPRRGGSEIAGVVDAVGEGVSALQTGDRVNVYHRKTCGECEWCLNGEHTMCTDQQKIGADIPGGFAEYVVVPAWSVDPIPDDMSMATAGAYASSFTTAWRMMATAGDLRPAESALVLGASGGVGNAALQIAERIGADTYAATSTDEKAAFVSQWADEVIDYTDVDFAEAIADLTDGRGVDLVADHVGQETWQTSIDSLAMNGRMVICGATSGPDPDIDIRSIYQRHRKIIGAPLGNRQDFRDVGRLIADGDLEPQIQRVLPLERLSEAYRILADREARGKVVIEP
ncbi:MAG: zinc-binding dehydrogenase [Haloglomus sp.]